ncbi:MAG: D-alanine--D-alanine ligase [Desulfatirhabdiaceae bacterium]|nr:D-alanine--D-alanine ligase [Desulfatirhabdiaceae bacterium]
MTKTLTVALLSGGISSEREVSLKSGEQVYAALNKDKYRVIRYDPMTDLNRLVADAPTIDVALIILHGPFGEDGTVQGLLDLLDIPYQGSGVLGSAIAMDKLVSKQLYEKSGIPTPTYITINRDDPLKTETCLERIGLPLVIKPAKGGSSIGMAIVKTRDSLEPAIQEAFRHDNTLVVETYIQGTELTVGVIGNRDLKALPVIEIIPDTQYEFFNYHAKYLPGATREICPARIDEALTEKAQAYAKMAHRALFCEGYSRTDMMFNNRELFILETNTIPGMTETSLLPLAAKTAGIPFSRLLDILIDLGIENKPKRS